MEADSSRFRPRHPRRKEEPRPEVQRLGVEFYSRFDTIPS